MHWKAKRILGGWVLAVAAAACGPLAPPVASAGGAPTRPTPSVAPPLPEPPEGPLPSLRTGELAPIEHKGSAPASTVARFIDDRYETLALEIVLPLSAAFDWSERVGARVSIDREEGGPYAFATIPEDVSAVEGHGVATAMLWVRRPKDQVGKPLRGVIFTPQLGAEPGHKVLFSMQPDARIKSDSKVLGRWASAFGTHLREIGTGPWNEFAATRVEEIGSGTKKRATGAPSGTRSASNLARLMETTSGLLSVQGVLQHDRSLFQGAFKEKRDVPVSKLSPPRVSPRPWDELLSMVPAPRAEPLAATIPAEFWYLRAKELRLLFRVAEQLDTWATPLSVLMDQSLEERDLAERYETQLGLARTALGELGPEVLESAAFAGSDPYLREGSDLTAVFKVRNAAIFGAAVEAMLSARAQGHDLEPRTTVSYGGARITVSTSRDGSIRQHRAAAGDLEIISNSLTATKRVLDAARGKRARLSDEKDFRYILARDAGEDLPVLFFVGERFLTEVVGPQQKVLEARRQMAAAELMTPGFAALLYGWIHGKSPASVDELLSSKLLRKEELKHTSGAAIDWRPGGAAQSSWGTPSSLTPLIELPPPDTVSESERAAYDSFSRAYETRGSRYLDPTAVRLGAHLEPTPEITAVVRALPLALGTDYRELIDLAGEGRVTASPLERGMRAVVGFEQAARARQELVGLVNGALGLHAPKLDFLGDWAMVGLADQRRIGSVVQKLRLALPQAPETEPTQRVDEMLEAARLPAYAAVEIKNASGAAQALASARKRADEMLRHMIAWNDVGTERGATIVRVELGRSKQELLEAADDARSELVLFYALTEKALVAALDESVLRGLLVDLAEGRGPLARRGTPAGDGSQLVVDLACKCDGGLDTVLGWLLAEQLVRASRPGRAHAEALLRGAPERASDRRADRDALRALSLAYFGAVPTPPHGGSYTLGSAGVRDPALGTESWPTWPSLPVPGSTTGKLLATLGRFRSEIAFDTEGATGGVRSLHVRASFGSCQP